MIASCRRFSRRLARPIAQRIPAMAVALLLPFQLSAQAAASTDAQTDSAQRRTIATLKSDLRNLVVAQEARFADRSAYASSVAELGDRAYRASAGSRVEIVGNTGRGYGAIARREGWAGSCVITVGLEGDGAPRTALEAKRFPEGEPACDGDGTAERTAFAREAQSRSSMALLSVSKLQERHFGRTGAYASDLAALTGLRLAATTRVTLELANAMDREPAFLAIATDTRYPGYSCVLASGWARFASRGTTLAEGKHAGGNSTPVCDTFK